MTDLGRMGGQSVDRTHRPTGGAPVGPNMIAALSKTAKESGIDIRLSTFAESIIYDGEAVCSVAGAYTFADMIPGIVRGDLFKDKITAVVCDNQPKTLERLREFWNLLGAKIIPTSAAFFDEITAHTIGGMSLWSSSFGPYASPMPIV